LFAPHTYIFVLRAHPVRGESYNQRNTTGEVATPAIVTTWLQGYSSKCKSGSLLILLLPSFNHAKHSQSTLRSCASDTQIDIFSQYDQNTWSPKNKIKLNVDLQKTRTNELSVIHLANKLGLSFQC